MWIVRLALRRPYTFAVLALLLLIIGPLSILSTPVDIFPNIDIPVVSIIWQYQGFSAEQMADRIVTLTERVMTTTVDNIEHIESNSLYGVSVVKIYFQPQVNLPMAIAQVTAVSQTQLRQLPAGTTPPLIIDYNASSVPILQLGVSGQGLTEQQLNDFSLNFIRTQLVTVRGAAVPYPYGGKQRQVQVDLDLRQMRAKGLSPSDISNTIANQNLILPSGTLKVGTYEYQVETNSAPTTIEGLNDLPIRQVNGAMVYIHDVAHVRDGFPPQTNIVRVDGQRAALLTIQKNGNASTLDIIKGIFSKLPQIKDALPPQLKITPLSDQSIFVRGAISGVVREALIAACLTGFMILVFLGSWRSTLIIAVSIPLSILVSLILLSMLGETINIMTLGGLALAVGILVDDATVEIENINRNLEEGKEIEQAILDGAAQIAIPAFVSTLSICIVFVPMFFLGGVAKYLFVPLAESVVFAMLASYFLSRTVVPTMAKYLLVEHDAEAEKRKHRSRNPFIRFQLAFERRFEQLRSFYHGLLAMAVEHSTVFLILFLVFCVGSFALLYPWLGQDFFPSVDAGQFKLHVRARTGTRIEETARLCDEVDHAIRREIPAKEVVTIIDNIGIPYSGLNLSYGNSGVVGSADADITVSLSRDHHPTDEYVQRLRAKLGREFPSATFYTLPVDMTTQILNFGLPAPIDIQVIGQNAAANHEFAEKLMQEIKYVPGTADLHIQQPFNEPRLFVDIDRSRAQDIGLTQRDVAGSLLVALSGSFQTAPTYWLNPKNGVSYNISTQTPQYALDSLQGLQSVPITAAGTPSAASMNYGMFTPAAQMGGKPTQILGNLSSITRGEELATMTHYNIAPVIDIYGNVEKTDLRSVADKINVIIDEHRKELPRGSRIVLRGQVQTMNSSFVGLVGGLIFSILLVYLLIVVNFQSWLDPFVIVAALPAALAGIVWMLFITGTHISVPALTGSIMCMGVATANSILVVSFAKEQLEINNGDATSAALAAGFTRFRPVLMTALAMIIGMVPMALGLGDGGEQNAPLGRAVIGGLLFATTATLFFVPTFFSVLHGALGAAAVPAQIGTDAAPEARIPETSRTMSEPDQTPHPARPEGANHGHEAVPEATMSGRTAVIVIAVVLIVGVVIAVIGIIGRKHDREALAAETTALAAPDVLLQKAVGGSPNSEIVLPGNIYAYQDAPIYARTNGYLSHWYFDIGAHVRKGQLLAVISSPEVDQQLLQARADLATAESNAGYAKNTAKRYQDLLNQDAVSRQDTENFTTQAQSSNTAVKSQLANVQRLEQLTSFEKIYAPFNGVLTSRSIDVGQLIDQGAAKELFHVASTDILRVYVNVPQVYSRDALPGAKAQLTFAEYPGRSFEGTLVRTAKSIDISSRTLLVEVDVDNRKGELTPGAYTEVHMKVSRPVATVVIPVSALLFRKEGLRVATVEHNGDSDVAKLLQVTLGHDDGDTVQIVNGIDPNTPIITDPPDSILDGEKVHVLEHPENGQGKAEHGQ